MKRKWVILWLIAPSILVAAIATTHLNPSIICAFQPEDRMDRVFCKTHKHLIGYDQKPDDTVEWLLHEHDGGSATQVMSMLIAWAIERPESFADLLKRLDDREAVRFVENISLGAQQRGQSSELKVALQVNADESKLLHRLLEQLDCHIRATESLGLEENSHCIR